MRVLFGPERAIGALTEADYQKKHRRAMRLRGIAEAPTWTGPAPVAYVSEATWCFDCPNCRAGVAVDPAVRRAYCLQCACVFHTVTVPGRSEIAALEAVLGRRPEYARNTLDTTSRKPLTVEDLDEENLERGIDPVLVTTPARLARRREREKTELDARLGGMRPRRAKTTRGGGRGRNGRT